MFGRNKSKYIVLLLLFTACWSKNELPEDQAKATLRKALSTLHSGNVEGYMQYVDFGGEMDSVQRAMMLYVLKQHQDLRAQQKGTLIGIEAIDAEMQGDTVCTVFCQLTFADSTAELISQKMVRVGEDWKIRVRN
jgi:hypothetical protein